MWVLPLYWVKVLVWRWLGVALTECVQKCWLLEVCENKKEAKRREKQKYRLKREEKRVVVEQI